MIFNHKGLLRRSLRSLLAMTRDVFARHFSAEACPQLLRNSVAGGQPFLYEKSRVGTGWS